jgi:hypothetical protein
VLNVNVTTFSAVVDQAMKDAAGHPRWLAAINRAVVEVLSNPWIERGDHGLIIGSPSGKCYAANGICQCTAFEFKQPCWHRAAAKLVRLHDEKQGEWYAAKERAEAAQAKTEVDADQTARRLAYEQAVREMAELYA